MEPGGSLPESPTGSLKTTVTVELPVAARTSVITGRAREVEHLAMRVVLAEGGGSVGGGGEVGEGVDRARRVAHLPGLARRDAGAKVLGAMGGEVLRRVKAEEDRVVVGKLGARREND